MFFCCWLLCPYMKGHTLFSCTVLWSSAIVTSF